VKALVESQHMVLQISLEAEAEAQVERSAATERLHAAQAQSTVGIIFLQGACRAGFVGE
jgi:hypothetical protein